MRDVSLGAFTRLVVSVVVVASLLALSSAAGGFERVHPRRVVAYRAEGRGQRGFRDVGLERAGGRRRIGGRLSDSASSS